MIPICWRMGILFAFTHEHQRQHTCSVREHRAIRTSGLAHFGIGNGAWVQSCIRLTSGRRGHRRGWGAKCKLADRCMRLRNSVRKGGGGSWKSGRRLDWNLRRRQRRPLSCAPAGRAHATRGQRQASRIQHARKRAHMAVLARLQAFRRFGNGGATSDPAHVPCGRQGAQSMKAVVRIRLCCASPMRIQMPPLDMREARLHTHSCAQQLRCALRARGSPKP